jgi:hypothetical protein
MLFSCIYFNPNWEGGHNIFKMEKIIIRSEQEFAGFATANWQNL